MPRCAWFGGVVSFELSYNSKNEGDPKVKRVALFAFLSFILL